LPFKVWDSYRKDLLADGLVVVSGLPSGFGFQHFEAFTDFSSDVVVVLVFEGGVEEFFGEFHAGFPKRAGKDTGVLVGDADVLGKHADEVGGVGFSFVGVHYREAYGASGGVVFDVF
jgi:hypothetical protein